MSHQHRRSGRRTALVLVLGVLGAAACEAATPRPPGAAQVRGELDRLQLRQPADVAVPPVRDQTGRDGVPRELVREAFQEALVDRLYSPLDSAYVDANWVESSFRGTPPPDALLLIEIDRWDPSRLYSSGVVQIGGDVVLFEGSDTTGRVLWSLRLDRAVDLSQGRTGPPAPSAALIPEAVRRYAREALERLPARDPVAAHRP